MCQTLNTVFHRSSHLLPSYKKYGLRLVFRWFLGFGYSCDHQTTLYKTLNKRHTTPLTSESTMISLHSIKYHLLQSGLSLRGGGRGFPPAFMNMSPGYSKEKEEKQKTSEDLNFGWKHCFPCSIYYIFFTLTSLFNYSRQAKIVQTPLSVSAGPDIWRCVRYFDLWGVHGEISRMKHCMPCLI